MMKTPQAGICRGEGHGYIAVDLDAPAGLTAQALNPAMLPVPCSVLYRPRPDLGPSSWSPVVVVPLFASDLEVTLTDGAQVAWAGTFSALKSKFQSRLLTQRAPALAEELRGIESRQGEDATRVSVDEIWPAGERRNAWRVHASFPTDNAQDELRVEVLNHMGKPIERDVVVMEDHVVPATTASQEAVRLVTLSILLDEDVRHACVCVSLGDDRQYPGFQCLLAYQADELLASSRARCAGAAQDPRYHDWFCTHRTEREQLAAQAARFAARGQDAPLVSVVAPESAASQTTQSLEAQTYARWELANSIDGAHGDYVALIGAGGTLEPDALWQCVGYLDAHGDVDLLYADEDVVENGRYVAPALKPAPDYHKLLSHYYLGYPLVIRREALDRMMPLSGTTIALDAYEIALRAFELGLGIAHLPRVLYHGTPRDLRPDAGKEAQVVAAHLERQGISARVLPGPHPHTNRVFYRLPDPAPHVSIVIPTKDHVDLLRTCLTSILDRTVYPSYDVVVVENNSEDPQTFAYYDTISRIPCVKVVTWQPIAHAENGFNYSAIVNHGARQSEGDLIVFLNNDTEVIAPDWLEAMAGLFAHPKVGLVGAKLLFGDRLVQHAGLSANPNCDFLHPNQNLTADDPGYLLSAGVTAGMPMVTGACQMVRRSLFEELGGYDEQLAVGFNDGDFCLRVLESGHEVVFCPHALLHHREFSTRGREANDHRLRARYLREKAYLMARHALFLAEGDPTVNPWLDRFSPWRELVVG